MRVSLQQGKLGFGLLHHCATLTYMAALLLGVCVLGGGQAQPYRMPTSPVQIPIPSRPSSAPTTLEDGEYGDDKVSNVAAVGRARGGIAAAEDACDT